MNNNLVEWGTPGRRPTAIQMLPVMSREIRRRHVLLAAVFAAVALAGLVVALSAPRAFTSSTTLLVEEANIIEPLLKGRTVPTTVVDRAGIAREVAFSRKVMDDILRTGGGAGSTPRAVER